MKTAKILIARPHGFCAGVWRALDIAEAACRVFPPPIFCLNELVHNRRVVGDLAGKGVRFVRSLDEVPPGATLVFSAHGVAPAVRAQAAARNLNVIDATCPFVAKVHEDARRHARDGCTLLLIGSRGHEEVTGVAGEAPPGRVTVIESVAEAEALPPPPDPEKIAVVTQTTLARRHVAAIMAVLRRRFPKLRGPAADSICYATTHRQEAVRQVARLADRVVVLGSAGSANSNRLAEVARDEGVPADLVENPADLARLDLRGTATLGLTAGASTPETMVEEAVRTLRGLGFAEVETLSVAEEILSFPLPASLRRRLQAPLRPPDRQ